MQEQVKNTVLLLTGRLAANEVSEAVKASDSRYRVEIHVLPISVAAFITPRMVDRAYEEIYQLNPDLILVPGLTRGDFASCKVNSVAPVRKGTRLSSQIPQLLESLPDVTSDLSAVYPADKLIHTRFRKAVEETIRSRENDARMLDGIGCFSISDLPLGREFPIRVIAEIVDAPLLSPREVERQVKYYCDSGADIIDIGAVAGESDPEGVSRCVQIANKSGLPVSVDSLNPQEIKAGVDVGAELVLSVDAGNWEEIVQFLSEDLALVVLPTNVSQGILPRTPAERADACSRLVTKLRKRSFTKLLPDLILEAPIFPGLWQSLLSFHMYRSLDENTPMLAGAGNVTEFVDSDSVGVNASLALLSQELGISALLTTEARPATAGAVRELARAVKMSFAAACWKSPPKSVGFDSFLLKTNLKPPTLPSNSPDELIPAHPDEKTENVRVDPAGTFRLWIDHYENRVLLEHRTKGRSQLFSFEPSETESSEKMISFLLAKGLVSRLDHAAYLGKEISKAEIALKWGRTYVQDMDWFDQDLES